MTLALWIARRYFFSRQKARFIHWLSQISVWVVAFGTMALLVALSVFNGLEDILRKLHNTFNPDIKIVATVGKSFELSGDLLQRIERVRGVRLVSEVIEDNALLKYRQGQMVATLKGVSDNYARQTRLPVAMVEGSFKLAEEKRYWAVLGRGVQASLSISTRNDFEPIQVWYPKRTGKIKLNTTDPEKYFNRRSIFPAGVFSIEQNYDDKYVFVPLAFARDLLEYGNRRTALEVQIAQAADLPSVQRALRELLGDKFQVLNRDEQEASLLRAIKVEKFFVYLTLTLILAVASINIFFALMMLVIDKRKDISTLRTLGASDALIRRIFFIEGTLIALGGAAIGLAMGVGLIWAQQNFGWIQMGTTTTIITAYPVVLYLSDIVSVLFSILFITLLSVSYPARASVR